MPWPLTVESSIILASHRNSRPLLDGLWSWMYLHVLICHPYFLCGEMSVIYFLPIFKLYYLCFYSWVLRVLYIYSSHESLVRHMVCKYFLPVCRWSFMLLTGTFTKQTFPVLMESNLLIFFSFYESCFYYSSMSRKINFHAVLFFSLSFLVSEILEYVSWCSLLVLENSKQLSSCIWPLPHSFSLLHLTP